MTTASTRKPVRPAPIVLDVGQGWAWVWLRSSRAVAAEAAALDFRGYKPDDRAPKAVFSLRDSDGTPKALLKFCDEYRYDCAFTTPNARRIITHWSESGIERRYWQAVPALALRLIVTGDPRVPVPDGASRFTSRGLTGTVMSRGGLPHRDDGPALEYDGGFGPVWLKDGVLHRIGGPAVVGIDGLLKQYFVDGLAHRDDGPAYESANQRHWLVNGKLHRLNAPPSSATTATTNTSSTASASPLPSTTG